MIVGTLSLATLSLATLSFATASFATTSIATPFVAFDLAPLSEFARSLNWIDIVLLLGLFAGLLFGVGIGFYRQVAIFTSLVVGVLAASRFSLPITQAEWFAPVTDALGPEWGRIAAFAGVLWISLIGGLLACLLFHSFFGRTVRICDGLLGGAMGVAISSLLFGLILLGLFHWGETRLDEPIRASRIGSRLAAGAQVVARLFPQDIQDRFDQVLVVPSPLDALPPGYPLPAGGDDPGIASEFSGR